MKTNLFLLLLTLSMILSSCIGDDFVDDLVEPILRITTQLDSLEVGSDFQLSASYFNNVGSEENAVIEWSSSDESLLTVSVTGLATAIQKGEAFAYARFTENGTEISDSIQIIIGENTNVVFNSTEGIIVTTSSYELAGSFSLTETEQGLRFSVKDDYIASTALPGLYVYLSNNQTTIANALEIAAVEVYQGAHEYNIADVSLNDYQYILYFCKPFNVKVGEGIWE